jgi:N-acetylglucosaminyldiphosphoundecaprenol N-acetyl-beta-D-mannosaminyltransferase
MITTRKLLVILGIPIDDLNMEEALERIEEFVTIGRTTGKTHQIATVNADFVVNALKDPELRYLLQEADMATADGMPLVWGARALGVPLEGRVTGADLVPALAERAAKRGFSLFLLGAEPGVAACAADVLKQRHPNLIIAGVASPPYSSVLEMDHTFIDQIKRVQPDILLVAFGNPKQEKWIGMYGREVGVPVMIGVGGTLDFIAGKTRRAPRWLQRLGLEWLYRLLQNPRRLWRRYVTDLCGFGAFFLRQWWIMRQGKQPTTLLPMAGLIIADYGKPGEMTAVLNVQGRMDISQYERLSEKAQQALAVTPHIIVNLSRAVFLDSSVIGLFVGLTKEAREAGGNVCLTGVPEPIKRTLSLLNLDRFFEIAPNVDEALNGRQQRHSEEISAIQYHRSWTVIKMPYRLDASNSDQIFKAGLAGLNGSVAPRIVLDFSETAFLASAGLATMMKFNRLVQEHGGELRVACCSSDVLRVIQMVRFDKVFNLFPDLAAATDDSQAGVISRQSAVGS